MTEQAIAEIHKQLEKQGKHLEKHGEKLETIQQTLQKIAVQDEQIRNMQEKQDLLENKIELLTGTEGTVAKIEKFQASCPRKQIHVLWYVVIPMGLSHLALAVQLLKVMGS